MEKYSLQGEFDKQYTGPSVRVFVASLALGYASNTGVAPNNLILLHTFRQTLLVRNARTKVEIFV